MDIVKKNLLSILCGAAVVLALPAGFLWPIPRQFALTKQKLADRSQLYGKLDQLRKSQRHYPALQPTDDSGSTEAPALRDFPTEKIIEAGEKAKQQVQRQSKQ